MDKSLDGPEFPPARHVSPRTAALAPRHRTAGDPASCVSADGAARLLPTSPALPSSCPRRHSSLGSSGLWLFFTPPLLSETVTVLSGLIPQKSRRGGLPGVFLMVGRGRWVWEEDPRSQGLFHPIVPRVMCHRDLSLWMLTLTPWPGHAGRASLPSL